MPVSNSSRAHQRRYSHHKNSESEIELLPNKATPSVSEDSGSLRVEPAWSTSSSSPDDPTCFIEEANSRDVVASPDSNFCTDAGADARSPPSRQSNTKSNTDNNAGFVSEYAIPDNIAFATFPYREISPQNAVFDCEGDHPAFQPPHLPPLFQTQPAPYSISGPFSTRSGSSQASTETATTGNYVSADGGSPGPGVVIENQVPPTPERNFHNLRHVKVTDGDGQSQIIQLPTRRPRRSSSVSRPFLLRRRTLLLLATTAVTFSFVCAVCLVLNFLKASGHIEIRSWRDYQLREGLLETCVPYISLQGGREVDQSDVPYLRQLRVKVVEDKTLYCATSSGQMSALFFLITKRQQALIQLNREAADQWRKTGPAAMTSHAGVSQPGNHVEFIPASAHKRLRPFTLHESQFLTTNMTRLTFNPNRMLPGEHARNVTFTKEVMKVVNTGWYYVYSSVRFYRSRSHHRSVSCERLPYKTWVHYIGHYKASSNSGGDLVKATTQCCEDCTQDDTTTFTGGVFLLERDDELFVEVKGPGIEDSSACYFGIVMLGSTDGTATRTP